MSRNFCTNHKSTDPTRECIAIKTTTRSVHFISIVFVSIVPCCCRLARVCRLNPVAMDAAGINSAEERHVSTDWIRNFIMLCFVSYAASPSFCPIFFIGCWRFGRMRERWRPLGWNETIIDEFRSKNFQYTGLCKCILMISFSFHLNLCVEKLFLFCVLILNLILRSNFI